ncbi:ABC transporter substrate-binding protein, partial [Chloroflexota bacterium]
FVFGIESLSQDGFIPWRFTTTNAGHWMAVYDALGYGTIASMDIIPGLAERWEFSTDYLTFTLFLRKGIPWQGGWGEVTADDIKYTLEQMGWASGTVSSRAGLMKKMIDSIEVKDPYTLIIHQKQPGEDLVAPFMDHCTYMPIACKKYFEAVGEDEANLHPVGSGPFRLVEHEFGDYMKFEAADVHWRCVPEFKYLVLQCVPEEATRIAMLKTGEIDATQISPPSLPQIPKDGFTIHSWPTGRFTSTVLGAMYTPNDHRYVEGYTRQDPWADIKVREAMSIAIDRDAINKALYSGLATPSSLPYYMPGWDKIEQIPYDPERAKQLLTEAGYPDGFSVDFIIMPFNPGMPMLPKCGEAAAGYWENIGIKVKILSIDFPAWFPSMKKGETAGSIWIMGFSYGEDKIDLFMPDRGSWEVYLDDELTSLGSKVLDEPSLAKRHEIYGDIARHHRNNYTNVPFFVEPLLYASNSQKVGEWPPWNTTFYHSFEYIRHAKPLNTWRLFTP